MSETNGGALKAGSVYVAVSASIGEFAKSMAAIVKQVEDTAKKVKESAMAVAAVGGLFAAGISAAVSQATVANAAMAADVTRLQTLLYTIAGDLGDLFAPAVKQLTEVVSKVVEFVQKLDPEVKRSVATFALFAAGTGVVAAGVGTAAGLVEGLAKASGAVLVPALKGASSATKLLGQTTKDTFPLIGKLSKELESSSTVGVKAIGRMALSFGAVLIPIAAVVAAVVGIGLAAGAVYAAWNDTSTGLRDAVLSLFETFKGWARQLGELFANIFTGLRSMFLAIAATMIDTVLVNVRTVAAALATLADAAGAVTIVEKLAQVQNLTGEAVVAAIEEKVVKAGEVAGQALAKGVAFVADVGKSAAQNVTESLKYSANGLKSLLGDVYKASGLEALLDKAQAAVDSLTGKPKLRTTQDDKDAAKAWEEAQKKLAEDVAKANAEERELVRKANLADLHSAETSFRAIRADAARMAQAMADAKDALASRFASQFQSIVGLVESFTEGMAASGGNPVAGVGVVVADLLTQSRGFQVVLTMVNNTVQMVANALGTVLVPMQTFLGATLGIVAVVANALQPALTALGSVLQPFVPVVQLVGEVLGVLEPLFTMLGGVIQLIVLPLRLIVEVQLRVFFEAIKWLGVGLMFVAQGISFLWNSVVEGVQWVLRSLAELPFLEALREVADDLNAVKVNRGELKDATKELISLTWEQARAKAEETKETIRNGEALKDANEALNNVPSAWRRAARSRQSQDPRDMSGSTAPPPPPPPPAPPAQQAAPPPPVVVTVVAADPVKIEAVQARRERDRDFRRGGGLYGGWVAP